MEYKILMRSTIVLKPQDISKVLGFEDGSSNPIGSVLKFIKPTIGDSKLKFVIVAPKCKLVVVS